MAVYSDILSGAPPLLTKIVSTVSKLLTAGSVCFIPSGGSPAFAPLRDHKQHGNSCHNCSSLCKKFGKFSPKRIQRYRCNQCKKTFSEEQNKPLDDMRIPIDKAVMALHLLLEGNAVASVERVTGLHKRTILNLLALAGERCERLMEKIIKDVPVRDVCVDEVWSYVKCHDRWKERKGITDETAGSKWTYIALESNSKVVLPRWRARRNRYDSVCRKVEIRDEWRVSDFGGRVGMLSFCIFVDARGSG